MTANDSSLVRHAHAASSKSLEIRGRTLSQTKKPFEAKICLKIIFQLL